MARYDWPVDVGAASPQSLLWRRRPGSERRLHRHIHLAIAGDMPSEPMHVRAELQPSFSRSKPGVSYLPRRVSAGVGPIHKSPCSQRDLNLFMGRAKARATRRAPFLPPLKWGVSRHAIL